MGESETAEATAPSAVREIQIRQDLAINKFGWAIRIPAGIDTSTAITLVTRVPTKVKSWRHEAEKLKEEGLAPWRTSLSLTPEERGENMSGVLASRCLLVGFALPELDKLYKSTSAPALQALAGTRPDHEPADIIPQSETMTPVMVVAPLPNLKETATEQSYVCLSILLTSRFNPDGLAQPMRIAHNECFYLPVIRAADSLNVLPVTSVKHRITAWHDQVRKLCLEQVGRNE